MITIHIAYEDFNARTESALEELCADLLNQDCNYSGESIEVEVDNFTSIDDANGIRGASLLAQVNQVIAHAKGECE